MPKLPDPNVKQPLYNRQLQADHHFVVEFWVNKELIKEIKASFEETNLTEKLITIKSLLAYYAYTVLVGNWEDLIWYKLKRLPSDLQKGELGTVRYDVRNLDLLPGSKARKNPRINLGVPFCADSSNVYRFATSPNPTVYECH